MKSLTLTLLLVLAAASLFAQNPQRRSTESPVPLVSVPIAEQDITITFHVSSELATAIENDRRQLFRQQTDANGVTSLVPVQGSLSDQILFRLQTYFQQVLQRFPPESLRGKQKAISDAQQAADDAAAKAATVVKK